MSDRHHNQRGSWSSSKGKRRAPNATPFRPNSNYASTSSPLASNGSGVQPASADSLQAGHSANRPIANLRKLSFGTSPHLANSAYIRLNSAHKSPSTLFNTPNISVQRDRVDGTARKTATPAKNVAGNPSSKTEGRIRKTIRPYNELAPLWKDIDSQAQADQDESPRRRRVASASARMRPSTTMRENLLPVQNAYVSIGENGLFVVKDGAREAGRIDVSRQMVAKSAKTRQRAARKTNAEVSESEEEEEETESEASDHESDLPSEEELLEGSENLPEQSEDEDTEPPIVPLLQSSPVRPRATPSISSGPPSDKLLADLETLIAPLNSLHTTPFLRRCVRRGFLLYCQREGLDVNHRDTPGTMKRRYFVIYRCSDDQLDEHCVELTSWNCPLCTLHGVFPSFDVLRQHVQLDHSEVKETSQKQPEWCLIDLSIPSTETLPARSVTPPALVDPVLQAENLDSMVQELESQQRLIITKAKARSPSPPPQQRQFETNQDRDPLGPLGSLDFPKGQYSCRPGGPKLYDHLHMDPTNDSSGYNYDYEKVFGILAWQVREKEEEIYESDDVKDEYKVMHVLWMRWITLNRNFLISDYYKGVETFIDSNVSTIAMAAGWRAMRYWLLILLGNRIISGIQVARLLIHYEEQAAACVVTPAVKPPDSTLGLR